MGLWRRIRRRIAEPPAAVAPAEAPASPPTEADNGVPFSALVRQLASADDTVRRQVALLLSGLGYRGAVRPLIRAYVRDGDAALLEALRPFGARLVSEAAREVRDLALGPLQRARLMDVLGASADPGAIAVVRPVAQDDEPLAHVAACIALAALGDAEGVRLLAEDLMRQDVRSRARAIQALERIGGQEAEAVLRDHVRRYLAAGGAIPRGIDVTMPLLIDPDADVAHLVAQHIRAHPQSLEVVTGPGVEGIAERHRETLASGLPGYRLLYSTPRHSPDEQLALLQQAQELAAGQNRRRVVLVGSLPAPRSSQLPPCLGSQTGHRLDVRIVLVGPRKPEWVLDWWRYVSNGPCSAVEMLVVLTVLVLGRSELTTEEELLQQLLEERDRDAFARAVLAHL